MRLLMIQGDYVGIYNAVMLFTPQVKRLAVFAGASQLDRESAEDLRLTPTAKLDAAPVEKEGQDGSSKV